MSDKKQTAVQWLYDELSHCLHREEVCDLLYKLEQKAKKLEKQQIIEAFKHGELPPAFVNFDAKEYYNETYGEKFGENYGGKDEN